MSDANKPDDVAGRFFQKIQAVRQQTQAGFSEQDLRSSAEERFSELWRHVEQLNEAVRSGFGPDHSVSRRFTKVDTGDGLVHGDISCAKPNKPRLILQFEIQGTMIRMDDDHFEFQIAQGGKTKRYHTGEIDALKARLEDWLASYFAS